MGVDIHERRRYEGKDDPNPAARRPNNWDPAKDNRTSRITAWRKARARSVYRYAKEYLGGGI